MRINKDLSAIQHILDYCDRIESTKEFFKADVKVFEENHVFRDAVALCVLQIGELTGILSDEFKAKYQNIPWRQIKALRNIVAHRYGTIDAELLWDIMIRDIPELKKECLAILKKECVLRTENGVSISSDRRREGGIEVHKCHEENTGNNK